MDGKFLAALLDLRIALGELQASMVDVDWAVRELMAMELGIKRGSPEPDNNSDSP